MTISPLDPLDERIRRAIAEKRLLEIRYKKAVRLAEPHDYGVIDGTERLLIFQLRGPDSGKGTVGWRLLDRQAQAPGHPRAIVWLRLAAWDS